MKYEVEWCLYNQQPHWHEKSDSTFNGHSIISCMYAPRNHPMVVSPGFTFEKKKPHLTLIQGGRA